MYYFDMDGVLAEYNWDCYEGDNPPYLTKDSHCYKDLKADVRAIEVMRKLHEHHKPVCVLTNPTNLGHLYVEQVQDKIEWLNRYVPWLDTQTQFIAIPGSKRNIIQMIRKPKKTPITINDILIDDWNPNLNAWNQAGGLGIKYCNNINSPNDKNPKTSYEGLHITLNMNVNEIIALLNLIESTSMHL